MTVSRFWLLFIGLFSMFVRAETLIDDESIAKREQLILGKPPKVLPLKMEQISEEGKALVSEMHRALNYNPELVNYEIAQYFATMLRHPELLKHQMRFSIMLFEGELDPRHRELAVLRNAWLNQAPYEWSEHVLLGKQLGGLTSEEIERVTQGSSAPGWGSEDRTVLKAVEQMHVDAMIAEETWTDLAEFMTVEQLLELPLLIGVYQGTAYLQNSVGFPLDRNPEGLRAR